MSTSIPPSSSTVTVRMINVSSKDAFVPAAFLLEPVLPGRENLPVPTFAFLIEHGERRIMFDLGIRKDLDKLPPAQLASLSALPEFNLTVERDVVEQLTDEGIQPSDIDTVIWSHTHLDHIGDMSKFPPTTTLVIGPGSDRASYPTMPKAMLLDSDFAGHEIHELSFSDASIVIGGLPALDFFGDGSFYVVDMPGHCPGHIVGLARVTPTTFILLGGDTCHHPGEMRPNPLVHKTFPCPEHILASTRQTVSTKYFSTGGSQFDLAKRTTPLLSVPSGQSFYTDRETSIQSIKVLSELDADPNIFVAIAHDITLLGIVDLFPATLDAWKEKGWKEQVMWKFLEEDSLAFRFN
ncbi:hypothetical protein VNI00_015594 [Paramarasmius palmivorus]|uniref:Metallo-beta-lactamase domain-containing protein n=1 Tax=Paramarasmius palmivorus TaxID=297713 RepID=A0AAW0BL41_9AGAR